MADSGTRVQLTPENTAKLSPIADALDKSINALVNEIVARVELIEEKQSITFNDKKDLGQDAAKQTTVKLRRKISWVLRGIK